jgi:hypothetical protein
MKLDKWDKQKRHSRICSVIGGDGDLYIGYEGQVPVLARVLLDLYFDYKQNAETTRDIEGALGRKMVKYFRVFHDIELSPEEALEATRKRVSEVR